MMIRVLVAMAVLVGLILWFPDVSTGWWCVVAVVFGIVVAVLPGRRP
jgi:hypothetical protein